MNDTLMIATIAMVFLVVFVLLEAGVITLFNLTSFKRALLQSLVANSTSVLLFYFLWPLLGRMNFDESKLFPLLPLLWASMVVVEVIVLTFFDRKKALVRLLLASAVMNTASLALLYFILSLL